MACTTCGTALPAGAKFCAECGTPVAAGCRVCGTELIPGAKFCLECGSPTSGAAAGSGAESTPSAAPVSERRVTSVLFGDLVGFTSLSETRDPEEVRELLGRYFDTARGIVARYGGTIEKFIGDAVMAVWGVPVAHEDDAERAVRAGLDLAEAVAAFGESVGAPGLAMRVGVVTGEVAVTLGASNQGMVAGDAVNTAARVQAKATPGTVWVDEQTRSLTNGSIDFGNAGTHELKGKAEPVALFAATAVRGGVGGERSSDRVQAPLVGRRRELSVLKEMFHVAAEEHRPRLVILSGDAGVGKTRLGSEFYNYIDGLSAAVLWHRGRCLAYGDGVAFSALTAAVRGRIGAGEDDTEAVTRAKLNEHLEKYVPDPVERAWLLPSLASLLGLPGAGGLSREDLFSAWLTWFERLSRSEDESIVWVVDDAHYADDGLLDFIEHLSTVAQAPMLIVLLARAELLGRRSELAALRRASVIGLETLSRSDIGALFDSLVEGLPPDVREALVERAEGNPLFAIETVRAMNDQGLTVGGPTRTPGAVRLATGVDAATLDALAAPASLQVLVASRLDLLPAVERSVLAAASVLGHTFSLESLAATCGHSDELPQLVRELIRRDLLTTITDRLSSEDGQYAFVQTVVRTVAYQTQSRRDRLAGHLAVVRHLEASADTDNALSTVIAQHLRDALALVGPDDAQHAELAQRLGQWLQRSAERSLAVGAPADAMRALDETVTLATGPDEQIRLRVLAAEAALAAGALRECIAYALPVVNGELAADRVAVAEAIVSAATAMRWSGRIDDGWALLEPYLADDALAGLPTLTACRLTRQIAGALNTRARPAEAAVWAERALQLAEDSGSPREIAATIIGLALGHVNRGHPRIGLLLLDYAADFSRENRLGAELGRVLLNLAAFGVSRDLGAAMDAGFEAMSILEQTGDVSMCWHVAINQSVALTLAGRWDEVGGFLDRPLLHERPPDDVQASVIALETSIIAMVREQAVNLDALDEYGAMSEDGRPESIEDVYFTANRALYARVTGDSATLAAAGRRAVELAPKYMGLDDDFPNIWSLVIGWLIDMQDFARSRELLRLVTDVPATRLSPLLSAQLGRLRGTIEALDPASDAAPDEVENDLVSGIAALGRVGALSDRARGQGTLGVWLTRHGRLTEAAPHLAAARETFTNLRATAWLHELESALSMAATG